MFCGKCGNQLNDNAKFCGKCGAPVKAPSAPVQQTATPESVQSVAPVRTTVAEKTPVAAQSQVVYQIPLSSSADNLKKSFGSVFAILAIVSYIVMFALRVVGAINASAPDLVDMLEEVIGMDLGSDIRSLFNIGTEFVAPAISIVALIPMLLIMVGLIYNIVQAYTKNKFSNVGMGFIKAGAIVKIIFASLVLIVSTALIVFRSMVNEIVTDIILDFEIDGTKLSAAADEFSKIIDGFEATMYVGIIAVAVWQVFVIAYNVFILVSVGGIKKAMVSSESRSPKLTLLCVSSYVMAALNIIKVSAVYIISGNTGLMMGGIEDTDLFTRRELREVEDWLFGWCEPNVLNLAAGIVLAVALILFCVNITIYNKKQIQVKN